MLVVGAITIAAGYYFLLNTEPVAREDVAQKETVVAPDQDVTIIRTSNGYKPKEVTISLGQTVLWTNESDDFQWPASNVHPTHRIYSEFDSLRPLDPNESWSFTFERVGEWRFHDHLRANFTGIITVVE